MRLCENFPSNDSELFVLVESNSIDHVERPMTNVEKLTVAIFTDYDSYKIPEELEEVVITSMTVKKVTYNIKKSLMETLMTLTMTWQDEKMAWDPSQYEDVSELRSNSIQHFYPWRPNLMLMKLD
jgi:Neurotransmitter-gated ion-channel ligand binding domain